MNCVVQHLAVAPKSKQKWRKKIQENGGIHRKQHKVHFSVHVLVVPAQDARIHFL